MKKKKVTGKTWLQLAQEINPKISKEEAEYILWNHTCFPFDNEAAQKQFIKFIKKAECTNTK